MAHADNQEESTDVEFVADIAPPPTRKAANRAGMTGINGGASDRHLGAMSRGNDIAMMRSLVESGLSFWDAAEQAGIPADLAYQQSYVDPELRKLLFLSRDRPILDVRHKRYEMRHGLRGSFDAKHDFMRQLYAAGLFDKLAAMVALADPCKKEGREVLAFMAKHVLPHVLPKETAQVIAISPENQERALVREEGERRLAELKEKNAKLEAEHVAAESRIRELEGKK